MEDFSCWRNNLHILAHNAPRVNVLQTRLRFAPHRFQIARKLSLQSTSLFLLESQRDRIDRCIFYKNASGPNKPDDQRALEEKKGTQNRYAQHRMNVRVCIFRLLCVQLWFQNCGHVEKTRARKKKTDAKKVHGLHVRGVWYLCLRCACACACARVLVCVCVRVCV